MNGEGWSAIHGSSVPKFHSPSCSSIEPIGSCPRRGTVSGELSAAMSCVGPKSAGAWVGRVMVTPCHSYVAYLLIMRKWLTWNHLLPRFQMRWVLPTPIQDEHSNSPVFWDGFPLQWARLLHSTWRSLRTRNQTCAEEKNPHGHGAWCLVGARFTLEMPRVAKSKLDTWCKEVCALDHAKGMQDVTHKPQKSTLDMSKCCSKRLPSRYSWSRSTSPQSGCFIASTKLWPSISQVLQTLQSQKNHRIFFAVAIGQPLLLCMSSHDWAC